MSIVDGVEYGRVGGFFVIEMVLLIFDNLMDGSGHTPGQGHFDESNGFIGHKTMIEGKTSAVRPKAGSHFFQVGHGMDQIVFFEESNLAVRRIQSDFIEKKESTLEPEIKQLGNIQIQRLQVDRVLTLSGDHIGPQIQ